jgi:hypothetical protein
MTDTSPIRWHTHPVLSRVGDTVDKHQKRVVTLCQSLASWMEHPLHDSDLLTAARYHDAAEAVLGDMPKPAKDRFPALAASYAKAELQVLTEMGYTWNLTRKEADMLHLCDLLDHIQFARAHNVTGDEWAQALVQVWKLAHKLDPDAAEWVDFQLARNGVAV